MSHAHPRCYICRSTMPRGAARTFGILVCAQCGPSVRAALAARVPCASANPFIERAAVLERLRRLRPAAPNP